MFTPRPSSHQSHPLGVRLVDPVRTEWMDVVYRGMDPDVGDLWCHRIKPGQIVGVWEPTDEERAMLAAGGRVAVGLLTEPIPPLSVWVMSAEDTKPVAPHPYKVIPELEERQDNPQ